MNLVSLLVAMSLIAVIAVGFARLMKTMFNSARHAELKNDVTSLKTTLSQMVDCGKTLNGIDLATQCAPAASFYFPLRDRNGNPITGPLATSGAMNGSGALGSFWHVRAHCDTNAQSVVIEAASPGSGKNGYFVDPATKRELAWAQNVSPINPVFGGPVNRMCASAFNVGAVPTCPPGKLMVGYDPNNGPVCKTLYSTQTFCNTTYQGQFDDWGCTAVCPAGTIATGGGLQEGAVYMSTAGGFVYTLQPAQNGFFCLVNIGTCSSGTPGPTGDGCGSQCYAICTGWQ
jgi:hypothetical protein